MATLWTKKFSDVLKIFSFPDTRYGDIINALLDTELENVFFISLSQSWNINRCTFYPHNFSLTKLACVLTGNANEIFTNFIHFCSKKVIADSNGLSNFHILWELSE